MPGQPVQAKSRENYTSYGALYNREAIPTIYLLDDAKTVLLRDPTFEQFEKYLSGYSTLAAGR